MGSGASSTSTRCHPAGLQRDDVGEMSDISSAGKCPWNGSDLSLGSTGELSLLLPTSGHLGLSLIRAQSSFAHEV